MPKRAIATYDTRVLNTHIIIISGRFGANKSQVQYAHAYHICSIQVYNIIMYGRCTRPICGFITRAPTIYYNIYTVSHRRRLTRSPISSVYIYMCVYSLSDIPEGVVYAVQETTGACVYEEKTRL